MIFSDFLLNLKQKPSFREIWISDRNLVKGTKKTRKLWVPDDNMTLLHRRLLAYLRNPANCPRFSEIRQFAWGTGSKERGRLQDMVLLHQGQRNFILLDIENAFGSVKVNALAEVLCREYSALTNCEDEVLKFLNHYCTTPDSNCLPLGLPASNDLFDLFVGTQIDIPLSGLIDRYDLRYSRWTDDFTFSSSGPIGIRKRQIIRSVINDAGLTINNRKCHTHNICKHGSVNICGINLGENGRIFISRRYRRHLFGLLHMAISGRLPVAIERKIPGKMGPFLSLIPKSNGVRNISCLNRSEFKLYCQYQHWRRARMNVIGGYV